MMSTLKKELDHTILRVERLSPDLMSDDSNAARHVAGGQHAGIIINKQLVNNGESGGIGRPFDLRLAFKVYLINAITQIHQTESRELRFWYNDARNENQSLSDRMQCAHTFFRTLVNPADFPKSYVAFIMKLMKTMQQQIYRPLVQIELEVRSVDEPFERPPSSVSSRPCKYTKSASTTFVFQIGSSEGGPQRSNNDQSQLPDLIQSSNPTTMNVLKKSISGQINRGPPPPVPPKPKFLLSPSTSLGLVL